MKQILNDRELSREVRKLFKSMVKEQMHFNCYRYNDNSRIVFKSYGSVNYKPVWERILAAIGAEHGYELFEGAGYRGDGAVYGMIKRK